VTRWIGERLDTADDKVARGLRSVARRSFEVSSRGWPQSRDPTRIPGRKLDLRFRAPVRPGDVITGTVEVTSARADKPITFLDVRVTRDDGVIAVDGTAVCYTEPLG